MSTASVSAVAVHVHSPEYVSTRLASALTTEVGIVEETQVHPSCPEEYSATLAPPTHPTKCVPTSHHALVTSLGFIPSIGEMSTSSVPAYTHRYSFPMKRFSPRMPKMR